MKKYDTVLFDLDGTLLDTSKGVVMAIEYTIKQMNLEPLPLETMLSFIGPPIKVSIKKTFNLSDAETNKALEIWRDYYGSTAIFEAEVYDGIIETLEMLKNKEIKIGVATYKKEDFAVKVLNHFGIGKYFDQISGADGYGKLTKSDVIKNCLTALNVTDLGTVLMVGDSDNDSKGAKEIGVDFVGVTYGFGFKTEDDLKSFPYVGCISTPNMLEQFFI